MPEKLFTFAYAILWVVTFVILLNTSRRFLKLEKKNHELEKRNLQLESHNRYLVARYGVSQGKVHAREFNHVQSKTIADFNETMEEVKHHLKRKDDYYDGIVEPQQYLDMELEWNKSNDTSKS